MCTMWMSTRRMCTRRMRIRWMSTTVVTNIKRNNCRLHHSGISIKKKERRLKLFCLIWLPSYIYIFFSCTFYLTEKFISCRKYLQTNFFLQNNCILFSKVYNAYICSKRCSTHVPERSNLNPAYGDNWLTAFVYKMYRLIDRRTKYCWPL